jgi:hypothetical protein
MSATTVCDVCKQPIQPRIDNYVAGEIVSSPIGVPVAVKSLDICADCAYTLVSTKHSIKPYLTPTRSNEKLMGAPLMQAICDLAQRWGYDVAKLELTPKQSKEEDHA